MPIINDIQVKHYDLTDKPVTIEISIDRSLSGILDTIEKECNEQGYTIDEFVCSLLENEIKKRKNIEVMSLKDILDANVQF